MDSYCHHPWLGLEITPQSEFLVCCKWQGTRPTSWDEYFNSSEIKQVKQQMLDGQRPSACTRCWQEEDAGLLSKRLLGRQHRFQGLPWEQQPLKQVSIAFGNTCNLACRICDSHSSSRWFKESQELKKTFPTFLVKPHNQFYKQPEFMRQLKQMTQAVDTVEFFGGEPFISGIDEQIDLLDHLCEHGPERIRLDYQTNGTTWPDPRLQQRWSRFKSVNLGFSLDGTDVEFEYNRHPARWTQVQENLFRMRDLARQSHNLSISITCTVSVFTIASLEDFIKWCLRNSLPRPHLAILYDPYYYDCRILPPAAKQAISTSQVIPENIKNWLNSQDKSHHIDDFRRMVSMQDAMRGENFSSTFPQLHKFLEEYHA
jgi:MoaA/NifB/PqqE/SkfB family radical SAM enzyme